MKYPWTLGQGSKQTGEENAISISSTVHRNILGFFFCKTHVHTAVK